MGLSSSCRLLLKVAQWLWPLQPHSHILHYLGGERVSSVDSSQASELLLSHWPELGHVPLPEPIIIAQKSGLNQSATTFGGECGINSIQNNRVENREVVIS